MIQGTFSMVRETMSTMHGTFGFTCASHRSLSRTIGRGERRDGDPKGWSSVFVTALGRWGKHQEGDPKGWYTVLVTALGSWGKHQEGDPKEWSTVLVTALGSRGKHREGDLKGWSTVSFTKLGSWRKPVNRGHSVECSRMGAEGQRPTWAVQI